MELDELMVDLICVCVQMKLSRNIKLGSILRALFGGI
jgi:hypothetical protein